MKSSLDIVAKKFNQLVKQKSMQGQIDHFSEAERAIWYVMLVRSQIDMRTFESVFFELLKRDEFEYFISVLYKLLALTVARQFEEAFELLCDNDYYGSDGQAQLTFDHLPDVVQLQLSALEAAITQDDPLWTLDKKLLSLLAEENPSEISRLVNDV